MAAPTVDDVSASTAPRSSSTTSLLQVPQILSTCHAAQILFGQPLYSHYLGWQSSILGYGGAQFPGPEPVRVKLCSDRRSDILGDFPSLLHYKHFMAYMIQVLPRFVFAEYFEKAPNEANGQHSETPFICGHRPHPGNEVRLTFLCSRCLIRHNNDTLKRIVAARQLMLRIREDGVSFQDISLNIFNMIWSDQKTHWREVVYNLEAEAELEAKWESNRRDEGLDVEQAVAGTISSNKVLEEAFTNCPLMLEGWGFEFRPKPRTAPSSCRYKSILRRHVSYADRQDSCTIANLCCGSKYGIPKTSTFEAADSSSTLRSFCEGSPEKPADSSSSPDTIAPSSPSTPLPSPNIVRKQFRWAEDVVQHVNRSKDCFQRRSAFYQPGRWACPEKHGWAYLYESEDEDSTEECSEDEDVVTRDGLDDLGNLHASNVSLETQNSSPAHAGPKDLPVETRGSQGLLTLHQTISNTNPLAEFNRTSTKRRRLNFHPPNDLPESASSDFLSEPNWNQIEAEGEAQFHRMLGHDNRRNLSLKRTPSLATCNRPSIKRRRVDHEVVDFAIEELSEMQKGAWNGSSATRQARAENYVESLSGSYLPGDCEKEGWFQGRAVYEY